MSLGSTAQARAASSKTWKLEETGADMVETSVWGLYTDVYSSFLALEKERAPQWGPFDQLMKPGVRPHSQTDVGEPRLPSVTVAANQ